MMSQQQIRSFEEMHCNARSTEADQQTKIYEALCNMPSAEAAVDLITNVCGLQILDDDMKQELINMGYLEEEDEND